MNSGAFILARKTFDSEIWQTKPAWWFKVWIYLIAEANHKDRGKFKKGSLLTSVPAIFADCHLENEGISQRAVENCIRWLKTAEQITTQKTTRGMWIFICNYSKYQDLGTYRNGTENGTENGIGTEQERNDKQQLNNETNKRENNEIKKQSKKKEGKGLGSKAPSVLDLKREYEEGLTKKPDFVNDVVWHEALLEMLRCKKEGKFLDPTKPEWLLDYDYRELLPFAVEHDIERGGLKRYAREIHSQYEAHDFKFVKTGKPIKNFKQLFKNIVNNEVEKLQRKFGKDSSFLH